MKNALLLASLLGLVAVSCSRGPSGGATGASIDAAPAATAVDAVAPDAAASAAGEHEIFAAVRRHDLTRVQQLIASGTPIDVRDADGETPLIAAFVLAVPEVSLRLRPSKTQIKKENLRLQKENDLRLQVAMWLLDHGADPMAEDSTGRTALFEAAGFGGGGATLRDVVARLLDAGVDINKRDNDGDTPLMEAARTGRADIVQYLIDRGADRAAKDRDGKSALDIAKGNNRPDVVRAFGSSAPRTPE